jgi:hypothetical protein
MMVPSELTRRVGMGELLVLLVYWKSGPYGVPDQQGDKEKRNKIMMLFQLFVSVVSSTIKNTQRKVVVT